MRHLPRRLEKERRIRGVWRSLQGGGGGKRRRTNYLGHLSDYIHLNPVRAGLVNPERGLGLLSYRWSSLSQVYAVSPGRRPEWCVAKRGLASFSWSDSVAGRRGLIEHLERRVMAEKAQECG